MNDTDVDLRSVHWQQGMLLTPEHFLRQEHYVDSSFLWLLRYCTQGYGLVGAGGRAEPAERGAAKYDPIIHIDDDGNQIKVSVTQCRGLSPSGDIIDIDPSQAVHRSFPKKELEGQRELNIYIVGSPHDKVVDESLEDQANPQMRASRRRGYRIELGISAAETPHGLLLSRLRKSDQSLRYEKIVGFIPLCTTLAGHSEMIRAWERLKDQLVHLTDRYTTLHRAVIEYITIARPRSITTLQDEETLQFVGRMVVTLENCTHEALDLLQPPQRLFQQLHRAIRSAALYLNLSPPTMEYFRQLAQAGETEFDILLQQERERLFTSRELTIHDDLSIDVQWADKAFQQLQRLEEALEGKYVDFRVSRVLEALNFFFDQRFDLYRSIARPTRTQALADAVTFVFATLRLEGRRTYRLILVMPEARLTEGDSLSAEILFNPGTGQALGPIYGNAKCEIPDQRNFAVDFVVPQEVLTISDLRVTLNTRWSIKTCLIYERRFLGAEPKPMREMEPPQPKPSSPPEPEVETRQRPRLRPLNDPSQGSGSR